MIDLSNVLTRSFLCGITILSVACAAMLCGCGGPSLPAEFVLQPEVKKLPPKHQKELAEILKRFYGDPGDPRWMTPAKEEPSQGKQGTASNREEVKLVPKLDAAQVHKGKAVYNLRCAPCHGISGDGAGAAAVNLDPKPRDYRQGIFKFTSTPRGDKPRFEDLARTIKYGAKGTAMPSFRWLPEDEIRAVIDYVKLLSVRGQFELILIRESEENLEPDQNYELKYVLPELARVEQKWEDAEQEVVRPDVPDPPMTDETIRLGAIEFQRQACTKCHGANGKGGRQPGIDPNDLPKDAWGHVAFPADLTSGMLHGGRRPIDVYRRIYSGINGSTMPAFSNVYKDKPKTIWYLVHFILSIVEGRQFEMPQVPAEPAAGSEGAASSEAGSAAGVEQKDGEKKKATQKESDQKSSDEKSSEEKSSEQKDGKQAGSGQPSNAESPPKKTDAPDKEKEADAADKEAGAPNKNVPNTSDAPNNADAPMKADNNDEGSENKNASDE